MEILNWLQEWYLSNCDDNWEHCYGVSITTLDNPGWSIKIEVIDTELEDKFFDEVYTQRTDLDWIHCKVKDNVFHGAGGSKNLKEILEIFQKWVLYK